MSEGEGGGEAVPGAAEASTDSAPTDNADAQIQEIASGERVYSEDEAPDFKQWKHQLETRDGEEPHSVDYEELIKGYLRQGDYTKKSQANAEERKTHESTSKNMKALLTRLRDPEGMIDFMHEAGLPIAQAMDAFQARLAAEGQLTPQEQHQNELQRQQERNDRRYQQQEQKMVAIQRQQAADQMAPTVQTWTKGALSAASLPADAEHRQLLIQELLPVFQQNQRPVTEQDYIRAASAIKERGERWAKSQGYIRAPKKVPPPSPKVAESYRAKTQEEKAAGNKNSYTSFQAKMEKLRRGY